MDASYQRLASSRREPLPTVSQKKKGKKSQTEKNELEALRRHVERRPEKPMSLIHRVNIL
jgi:hypothetical protein